LPTCSHILLSEAAGVDTAVFSDNVVVAVLSVLCESHPWVVVWVCRLLGATYFSWLRVIWRRVKADMLVTAVGVVRRGFHDDALKTDP
jgi:hypothetical protein